MRPMAAERETEYESLRALMRAARGEQELARLLARALREELTPRQAQLVRLYYGEQHTMAQIAAMLHINPSTVSRTLAAARRRLRRCLRYGSRIFLRED